MKALTLTQPWATLVAFGAKRWETRSWACYYDGPLAIHAAKHYPKRQFAALTAQMPFYAALRGDDGQYLYPELQCGEILCITKVLRCVRTEKIRDQLTEKERAFGNYADGRWAFELGDVHRIVPVPAVGHQLLWDWDGIYQVIP